MAWNSINCLVFPGGMLLLKSGDRSRNINYSTSDSTMSLLSNDPHWIYLQLLPNVCCVSLKTFIAFHGAYHTIWMQFIWEGTVYLMYLNCQLYPCVYTAPEEVTAGSRETPCKTSSLSSFLICSEYCSIKTMCHSHLSVFSQINDHAFLKKNWTGYSVLVGEKKERKNPTEIVLFTMLPPSRKSFSFIRKIGGKGGNKQCRVNCTLPSESDTCHTYNSLTIS